MGYDQLKLFGAALLFGLGLAMPLSPASAAVRDANESVVLGSSAPVALPAAAVAEKPIVVADKWNKNKNWDKNWNKSKNWNNKNWNKNWNNKKVVVVRPYRRWNKRPYYGTVIGGVALGTVLGAAAYNAGAPAPNLCWYWADPTMTSGYWDYCY